MIKMFKQFWNFISFLGIDKNSDLQLTKHKIQVFFNRSLLIGVLGIFATLGSAIPFIGNYAYLNLVSVTGIIVALIIHSKGKFEIAKRVAVYSTFCSGIILTAISGGDFLYHVGVISVLAFCWIIFDSRKELPELIFFIVITLYAFLVGELNLFDAEEFSQHVDTPVSRIANLFIPTILIIVFINFIRILNRNSEAQLNNLIKDKEALLNRLRNRTEQLRSERNQLEATILKRTAELQDQKEVLVEKNAEKEILLKEIHHRVKNNLQIIVSLLNLQSSKFDDEAVLKAIEETQNRIIAMSLVHQRMYQTSNFKSVQIHDYIDLLMENNKEMYQHESEKAHYKNDVAHDLSIEVEKAIPLGLVINEMINNSFKHAFIDTHPLELIIKINQIENGKIQFMYRDNGPGLPLHLGNDSTEKLGMHLIQALVEQIDGNLTHRNENGAVFEFEF